MVTLQDLDLTHSLSFRVEPSYPEQHEEAHLHHHPMFRDGINKTEINNQVSLGGPLYIAQLQVFVCSPPNNNNNNKPTTYFGNVFVYPAHACSCYIRRFGIPCWAIWLIWFFCARASSAFTPPNESAKVRCYSWVDMLPLLRPSWFSLRITCSLRYVRYGFPNKCAETINKIGTLFIIYCMDLHGI